MDSGTILGLEMRLEALKRDISDLNTSEPVIVEESDELAVRMERYEAQIKQLRERQYSYRETLKAIMEAAEREGVNRATRDKMQEMHDAVREKVDFTQDEIDRVQEQIDRLQEEIEERAQVIDEAAVAELLKLPGLEDIDLIKPTDNIRDNIKDNIKKEKPRAEAQSDAKGYSAVGFNFERILESAPHCDTQTLSELLRKYIAANGVFSFAEIRMLAPYLDKAALDGLIEDILRA
jgi:DNA repair exonuclease SbcCD ATPase subunit